MDILPSNREFTFHTWVKYFGRPISTWAADSVGGMTDSFFGSTPNTLSEYPLGFPVNPTDFSIYLQGPKYLTGVTQPDGADTRIADYGLVLQIRHPLILTYQFLWNEEDGGGFDGNYGRS